MYIRILLVLSFLLVLNEYINAQIAEYEAPAKLSTAVNSSTEESMPILAPDNKNLFFVRTLSEKNYRGRFGGQDIWVSRKNDKGKWSIAINSGKLNNNANNAVVGFNKKGNIIYLLNTYKGSKLNKRGLSYSRLLDNTWIEPVEISLKWMVSKSPYYGVYMHSSEKILLISMDAEGTMGQEDLYVSLKDSSGNWKDPLHLGSTINSPGFEISPFLSQDGQTLYFSSNGQGGLGDADLFMTTRLYNSWTVWTKPINLNALNSSKFDAYLSITPDSTIYFSSNREGNLSDIYQSKIIKKDYRDILQLIDTTSISVNKKLEKVTESETNKFLGVSIPRLIYFNLNSFEISPEDKELLYYIAGKLENNTTYFLEVIGHTDQEGGSDFNMELSIRRAEAVKNYFATLGLDRSRIITVGKGATKPIDPENSLEANEKNRRVEINFLK